MAARVKKTTFGTSRATARITTRKDVTPMKEVQDGTEINLSGYVIQEITNEETGEIFDSILVADDQGNVYATRSATFIRDLEEIMSIIESDDSDEPVIIRLSHGKSKKGQVFATCSLA